MAAATLHGRRVQSHDEFWDAGPGAYLQVNIEASGEHFRAWMAKPPCGHTMHLAYDPRQGAVHEVDENADGTITVEPKPGNSNSILCRCGWHGYIEAGVWREV